MEQRRKHIFQYGGVLLFHFLCIGILCIYIILMDYYSVWQGVSWTAKKGVTYNVTRDYAQNIKSEVMDLIEYIHLREAFETKGEYDPDRMVDIYDYSENDRITGENVQGLVYKLSELYNWSR